MKLAAILKVTLFASVSPFLSGAAHISTAPTIAVVSFVETVNNFRTVSLLFRSFNLIKESTSNSSSHNHRFHVCTYHENEETFSEQGQYHLNQSLLNEEGRYITKHRLSLEMYRRYADMKYDSRTMGYFCGLYVSQLYFDIGAYETTIALVAPHLFVTSRALLEFAQLMRRSIGIATTGTIITNRVSNGGHIFACAPRKPKTKSNKSNQKKMFRGGGGGVCEMDLFLFMPVTGHLLYQIANATAQLVDNDEQSLLIDDLLDMSISRIPGVTLQLTDDPRLLPIVRADKYWRYPVINDDTNDNNSRSNNSTRTAATVASGTAAAAFIEFDDKQQSLRINISTCTIGIHVDYPFYNTIPIITKSMNHIISSDLAISYLAGCISYDDYLYLRTHFDGSPFSEEATRALEMVRQQRSSSGSSSSSSSLSGLSAAFDTTATNTLYAASSSSSPRENELQQGDELKLNDEQADHGDDTVNADLSSTTRATSSIRTNNTVSSREKEEEQEEEYKARIIDGLLFYDEIGMLLLRLHALKDTVDHHIIVESNSTFTGKTKPLYFAENKALFSEFLPRITHVVIDQMPYAAPTETVHVWANEYFSRDAVVTGLEAINARDEDIVLIADTDEIPHPVALQTLRSKFRFYNRLSPDDPRALPAGAQIYKLFVDNYLYNFDCFVGESEAMGNPLTATTVKYAREFAKESANYQEHNWMIGARLHLHLESPLPYENVIYPGGWHLSFFESVQRIKRKIESYSHQNFIRQFAANATSNGSGGSGGGSSPNENGQHGRQEKEEVLQGEEEEEVLLVVVGDGETIISGGVQEGDASMKNSSTTTTTASTSKREAVEEEEQQQREEQEQVQEVIPVELPLGVEMSPEAIAKRVAAGGPIDYRKKGPQHRCRSKRPPAKGIDEETNRLRLLWESVAREEDRVDVPIDIAVPLSIHV